MESSLHSISYCLQIRQPFQEVVTLDIVDLLDIIYYFTLVRL